MIFLRHPTPDIPSGICYGQTDMDIAEEGHAQIEKALSSTPPLTRIIASPAKRCRKLAEKLTEKNKLQLHFDARLWEMNMGDWEGIAWVDIDRKLTEQWLKDAHHNNTPNGECFADVEIRVAQCIKEILADKKHNQSSTAIFCHASPIRATQMAWEGLSFKEAFGQVPSYATPITVNPNVG
jgi:alpha-ribazole phosphatase